MQTILIVIHLFVAIALSIVVLLQRSEGGALGIGGGGGSGGLGGFFSPRGAASTLTRTTAVLGLIFFLTSLSLTWLALNTRQRASILDSGQPAPTAPATPAGPAPRGNVPPITTAPAAPAPAPAGPATAPAATAPAPAPAPAPTAPAPAAPAPAP
jgi:preprotein translocase subunit SecG